MNLLKMRLDNDSQGNRRQLEVALERLEREVQRARDGLKAGQQLDESLIQNASIISCMIAKYNVFAQFAPYVDEPDPKT